MLTDCVAEVVTNHGHVDARLQKGDRATVAHHVRRHAAKSWCRLALRGQANVFLKDVGYAVSGERRALSVLEKDFVTAFNANDTTQCRSRLGPKRADSLFSPLTPKPHLSWAIERSLERTAKASLTRAPVL